VATLSDDTKTRSNATTTNYGMETTLRTKLDPSSGGSTYRTFIKFRIDGLTGKTLTGATLRLKAVTGASPDGGDVYMVSSLLADGSAAWTESTLTWANMPALPSARIGTAGAVDPAVNGGVVNIVLEPAAFNRGDGVYSLALQSHVTTSAYYSSKEGGTPPVLVLTTS
jgi:hypothetical protein